MLYLVLHAGNRRAGGFPFSQQPLDAETMMHQPKYYARGSERHPAHYPQSSDCTLACPPRGHTLQLGVLPGFYEVPYYITREQVLHSVELARRTIFALPITGNLAAAAACIAAVPLLCDAAAADQRTINQVERLIITLSRRLAWEQSQINISREDRAYGEGCADTHKMICGDG